MRIVVNHLTRMQPGYICVAGIEPKSGNHVRPVLAGRLGTDLLAKNGGPFDIATLVDVGPTRHCGSPPETEDHLFTPANAAIGGEIAAGRFWDMLCENADSDLRSIFGAELQQHRTSAVVNLNRGVASLGCIRLETRPRVEVNSWGKIRAYVNDGEFDLDLSVTDLRLYRDDHQTPKRTLVAEIESRIRHGVPVVLAVGLTRGFRSYHWLQVNNIHLEDDPVWKHHGS
jgi:hypothetical protein